MLLCLCSASLVRIFYVIPTLCATESICQQRIRKDAVAHSLSLQSVPKLNLFSNILQTKGASVYMRQPHTIVQSICPGLQAMSLIG